MPDALHKELGSLRGDIGQETGIQDRLDIGKLGLRFYEDIQKGLTPNADEVLAAYPGPRQPGVRPPYNKVPSGLLEGYRKPLPTPGERAQFDVDPVDGDLRVK